MDTALVSALRDSTIVFDLDGTLVDTAPDLVGATNHALASLGLDPRQAWELRPWVSYGARRMLIEALRASGAPAGDALVDRLLETFLAYYEANIARESRPFPGALPAIVSMRRAGARVAICTNKREVLTFKLLAELGIAREFDAVIGRDTLPVSKPDPKPLMAAVERAGGTLRRAVMIGDSAVDIATARAARVPVVGVTFGYSDTPLADLDPDVLLHDYAALLPALSGLLGHGLP